MNWRQSGGSQISQIPVKIKAAEICKLISQLEFYKLHFKKCKMNSSIIA